MDFNIGIRPLVLQSPLGNGSLIVQGTNRGDPYDQGINLILADHGKDVAYVTLMSHEVIDLLNFLTSLTGGKK